MKTLHEIKPITYLKTKSAELVKRITDKQSPVIITQNGEAKVVMQDVLSYERDRSTLLMLKLLAQGLSDVEHKRVIDQDNVFKLLNAKFP